MPSSDPGHYGQCLASDHLMTLAGLMRQADIDLAWHVGTTHNGTPFSVLLVQGLWSERLDDIAKHLSEAIATERARRKVEAERG